MTIARAAVAALALLACSRSRPAPAPTAASDPARGPEDPAPLLTKQKLSDELRLLVDEGHAHPAVASLEAAGCDLALVWKAAKYNRFVDLQHGTKMPLQARPPTQDVVWCQSRAAAPPSCAQVAPIFVRVAQPAQPFQVLAGYNDPPFTPRCSGLHDKDGTFTSGEGPGYASAR